MSNFRQDDEPVLVRTYGVTFSRNKLTPPASEAWDQVVYANKGVLTVKTEVGTWVVPPYRAIWLPANMRSTLEVQGLTALRMLYLRKSKRSYPFDRSKCAVLSVSPLLRELILRAVNIGALEAKIAQHRRMADLIQDELQAVDTVPLQLPYPNEASARVFASLIEENYDIEAALSASGSSRRTMERVFRRETAMSLGQWVRRRKLLEGLQSLVEGETTASVAFRLGYNGPSAFIAMFKRELGATPGSYLAEGR